MIPTQPDNLFALPFAQNGNYSITPETTNSSGRASQSLGFPPETQRPLNDGGVAPNRLDFNGLFHMLSAFAFWQQSGGQFSYKTSLNYSRPNIVYHNEIMWWCLKENGPDSVNGPVEPGTDGDYWQEYLQALAESGGGSSSLGNPVGTVIQFWGTTAPDGYFSCDGSEFSASSYPKLYDLLGQSRTPDIRGYFIRGYDSRDIIDPDGGVRIIGSVQNDSGRKIEGQFGFESLIAGLTGVPNLTGPFFYRGSDLTRRAISAYVANSNQLMGFSTDRVWGEASGTEFRPKNVTMLFCIKHD